ncbi:hypothetical protein D0Z07_1003 [Hyphodiscus hymeniophilus]|uniref:PLC-like phosphodiesterase n=1 Tax=Hyphodiscus hymeniophilus TaxID=353542 RepID=A0A9P7B0Q2_9HELO|nr:hypothetical protein D0Z07_1003 [Hyphodiscus hymeniophilus]
MRFMASFLQILAIILFLAIPSFAKSKVGYVTLINATPYDWKLTDSHSYQVEWSFPKEVKAGTAHEQYIKFKKNHRDDTAEAFYSLENSPSPASFIIKARAPRHIEVQFQETLASLNNPEGSTLNLGFVENGVVSFVLSGDTDSYISSNPPVAWMQSMLSAIGSRSMRDISIPGSHDSGMSEVSYSWGGHPHNTQTQSTTIYHQLIDGARLFDIRPTYYNGRFYEGHFTRFGSGMVGGTGRKISDTVKDINLFTNQYPGELVILDISHEMDATKNFRGLSVKKWGKFFEEMSKLQALWIASSDIGDDLSLLPISTFIAPGSQSAVLVRLPDGAPLPGQSSSLPLMERDVAAIESTAGMDHTDGMMQLGPAQDGDDSDSMGTEGMLPSGLISNDDDKGDNATATHRTNGPTPSVLSFDQRVGSWLDESSDNNTSSPDTNSQNIEDIDNAVPTPSSPPSSIGFFPLPTSPPAAAPEPLPTSASRPPGSSSQAFIHARRLPITGSYSNTDKPSRLIADQLNKLAEFRSSPQAAVHKSTWTITQRNLVHITDVANRKTSIIGLAIHAKRALLGSLWDGMIRRSSWPNVIEIDDFRGSEVTSLCMAINDYFAKPSGEGEASGINVMAKRRRRVEDDRADAR